MSFLSSYFPEKIMGWAQRHQLKNPGILLLLLVGPPLLAPLLLAPLLLALPRLLLLLRLLLRLHVPLLAPLLLARPAADRVLLKRL